MTAQGEGDFSRRRLRLRRRLHPFFLVEIRRGSGGGAPGQSVGARRASKSKGGHVAMPAPLDPATQFRDNVSASLIRVTASARYP